MWAEIAGYKGRYQVSRNGQVRNAKTGRILAGRAFPNGYLSVQLGRDSGSVLTHRLVAAAFIPGDGSLQVNHKNGNRQDNRVENLEWVTCSDNHRHSYRELDRKPHAKKRAVRVGGQIYESGKAAAQAVGVVPGSIASALNKGHLCRGMEVTYV